MEAKGFARREGGQGEPDPVRAERCRAGPGFGDEYAATISTSSSGASGFCSGHCRAACPRSRCGRGSPKDFRPRFTAVFMVEPKELKSAF